MTNPQYYLIVDLECTCCDDDSFPRSEREIIEIGAVMVDATTLESVEEFNSFIRPTRHSKLAVFCTALTSIMQADVDSAPLFSEVIKSFQKWIYSYPNFQFCSWGDFDKRQLRNEAAIHEIGEPAGSSYLNSRSYSPQGIAS